MGEAIGRPDYASVIVHISMGETPVLNNERVMDGSISSFLSIDRMTKG
jgi:hypothetical protein